MIAKYTFLSGNIAIHVISIFHRSLQTNLINESIEFIAIHPYNLVTATRKKSCSVRKCMVHITNRRLSVQPLHLVVLTRFPRWYYKKLHEISTRKILLKTILTTRFLVTVPRNLSQCDFLRLWLWKSIHFSSPVTMRCKNDFLLKRSNKILQVVFRLSMSLSFNSYGTHFPSFWIFSIACKRLEIVPWSTPNAFANCFRVWVESLSSNACNSASLNFFGGFRRSLLLRSKSPLLKRQTNLCTVFLMKHGHHKLSQEYDDFKQRFSLK